MICSHLYEFNYEEKKCHESVGNINLAFLMNKLFEKKLR